MSHQVVWVDIPVQNLERAIAFYSAVLGAELSRETREGNTFGLLPGVKTGVSGCLYQPDTDNVPSKTGPLIYLSVAGRLDAAMEATPAKGGRILSAKQPMGEYGWRVIILDSEGNRLALHSPVP